MKRVTNTLTLLTTLGLSFLISQIKTLREITSGVIFRFLWSWFYLNFVSSLLEWVQILRWGSPYLGRDRKVPRTPNRPGGKAMSSPDSHPWYRAVRASILTQWDPLHGGHDQVSVVERRYLATVRRKDRTSQGQAQEPSLRLLRRLGGR